MRPVVHAFPFRRLMGAVLAYCIPPHRLVRHEQDGAYAVIVREGLDRLRPFIWMNNGEALPAKRYGRLSGALCAQKTEAAAVHQHAVRAAQAARRRGMGVRRTGLTARRAGARR